MNIRQMGQWIVRGIVCVGVSLVMTASANAVPVSYQIGNYSEGNFSASWLHSADYCGGAGPDSGLPLCMNGETIIDITGTIEGDLVSGVLSVTGGQLWIGGNPVNVLAGALGAFGLGNVWSIEIDAYGEFFFENIDLGPGRPNYFDGHELILWGQNIGAYLCALDQCADSEVPWGIDLYGKRIAVPEPGTLALLGIGLLAMAAIRRRKTVSA